MERNREMCYVLQKESFRKRKKARARISAHGLKKGGALPRHEISERYLIKQAAADPTPLNIEACSRSLKGPHLSINLYTH